MNTASKVILTIIAIIIIFFVGYTAGQNNGDTVPQDDAMSNTESQSDDMTDDSAMMDDAMNDDMTDDSAMMDQEYAYVVDPAASTLRWNGNKVVGASHTGTVDIASGGLMVDDENHVRDGSFVIDMTTITDNDLQGAMKAQLEGHLASDDFFSVETYPTAEFVISDVVLDSVSEDVDSVTITGDLTIKGITNSITFPAIITRTDSMLNATADIVIDRSRWNVRFGSDSFFDNLGDNVIEDEITLNVDIVANQQ